MDDLNPNSQNQSNPAATSTSAVITPSTPSTTSIRTANSSARTSAVMIRLLFSLMAVGGLVLRAKYPNLLPSDAATVGLLVAAVLPWVPSFLETAELPGGWKFKFRELQDEQERQKRELETLRFLMTYFVTDYELIHLRKLAEPSQSFLYEKSDSFVNELRRLRSLGFITNFPGRGIRSMLTSGDLRDYFKITDRGTTYLQLRGEWDADDAPTAPPAPPEAIEKG